MAHCHSIIATQLHKVHSLPRPFYMLYTAKDEKRTMSFNGRKQNTVRA